MRQVSTCIILTIALITGCIGGSDETVDGDHQRAFPGVAFGEIEFSSGDIETVPSWLVQDSLPECPETYWNIDARFIPEELLIELPFRLARNQEMLFEDALIGSMCQEDVGVFDGTGEEPGPTAVYFKSHEVDRLFDVMKPTLCGMPPIAGSLIIKRYEDRPEVWSDLTCGAASANSTGP